MRTRAGFAGDVRTDQQENHSPASAGDAILETYLAAIRESLFKSVLWLYGPYTLLNGVTYLIGYYLLPEGFMRGSPQAAAGRAATTGVFWSEMALTRFLNLGLVVAIAVLRNPNQVRRFPVGYLVPVSMGIFTGLISGTNSFTASDLTQYNARDGMALGLSIGNFEMLGYILIIAGTVAFGVYQYRSWWRWSGEWKATKIMRVRDVRLSRAEVLCLVSGVLLLLIAAYRETALRLSS
jgi:hypothetical protein